MNLSRVQKCLFTPFRGNAWIFFREFRVLIFLSLLALCGCSSLTVPTLRAANVGTVPLPNGMIESSMWKKAPPLRVRLRHPGGHSITAEIRAISDGRAMSILVGWPDQTESVLKRAWVRRSGSAPWQLEEIANDRLWLLFPLTKDAPKDLYRPPEARYDLWEWQSAWTDKSGYADDGLLETKFSKEPPKDKAAVRYPNAAGAGFIEQVWKRDAGEPGTVSMPMPSALDMKTFERAAMSNPDANGSAIDVRATGKFGKQYQKANTYYTDSKGRTPGYWFGDKTGEERPGSYFVEFYRMMITADDEDVQFKDNGPYRFQLAVIDNKSGVQPFLSPPLRLEFELDR